MTDTARLRKLADDLDFYLTRRPVSDDLIVAVGVELHQLADWLMQVGRNERCPGCGLELPAGDLKAQAAHMQSEHPELIARRLEQAGFRRGPDGEWIDTLT